MRQPRTWILLVILLLLAGWWWRGRPVARAAGIIAPDGPIQANFATPQPPIAFKDAVLHPQATFALTARVLARENYHFDAGAELAPTDLAIGWGRMSDSAVLERMRLSQGGRFFYWQVRQFPIPEREIETHSANLHMIPADAMVAHQLRRVRAGDVVTLNGLLVNADKASGWHWRTSMTRDDTGDGACELVYVESLSIGGR